MREVGGRDYGKDRRSRPSSDEAEDYLEEILDAEPVARALPADPPSSRFFWYGFAAVVLLALFAVPIGLLCLLLPPLAWGLAVYGVLVLLGGVIWLIVFLGTGGRLRRSGLPLATQALGGLIIGAAVVLLVLSGQFGFLMGGPAPLVLAPGKQPASPKQFDGLIAYWNFDEADGSRAVDQSGDGLDGVVQGARRFAGVKGQCLSFNGRGDCVDCGTSPQLNFGPGAPFTCAGWLQTRTRMGAVLSLRNSNDDGAAVDLVVRDGYLDWYVRNDHAVWIQNGEVRSAKPINDGQWHHFAATRTTGGRVELYIDGALQGWSGGPQCNGSVTTNLRFLGTERYWVQSRWYEYPHFAGYLDEIGIYNRALKPDEIQALAGK